ncbi:hypothetical protein COB55_05105 [Candidatus Wolfebacteria bacterium]|nr:MAG: hypothetical protein COB55_05105 [Candidatus Wolfebacteria bacterium]
MTKECKGEIKVFVQLNGWARGTYPLIYDDNISRSSIIKSAEGKKRNIVDLFNKNNHDFDRYFLEFIGHILRKHKITKIRMNYYYISKTWKFDDIILDGHPMC